MTSQEAAVTMKFMERVDLKGAEVQTFTMCMQALFQLANEKQGEHHGDQTENE